MSLAIKIQDLSISYGDVVVFDKLSIEFVKGAWHAILGRSGAGKSVFIKCLAGISDGAKSQSGLLEFAPSTQPQRCAYMAQQDLLLPWLDVIGNVQLAARLTRSHNQTSEQRARDLLNAVGMGGYAKRRVQELSGGQRQRVALARTLMQSADIILMDEPFSAVDALSRASLQNLALELLQNKTVILITHDPFEALRVADYVHVLQSAQFAEPLVLAGSTPRSLEAQTSALLYDQLLAELCEEPSACTL